MIKLLLQKKWGEELPKIKLFYKESVEKDLKKFNIKERVKILNKIEKDLSIGIRGKKLKGEFEGLYSYRVGNYRVVYCLIEEGILILRIRHRKEVYK